MESPEAAARSYFHGYMESATSEERTAKLVNLHAWVSARLESKDGDVSYLEALLALVKAELGTES